MKCKGKRMEEKSSRGKFSQEKKIAAAGLLIIAAANAGALCMWMGAGAADGEKLTSLERPEYGAGEYEEELLVESEGERERVRVRVGEKEYSNQEASELLRKAKDSLEERICGKNESLEYVEYPLHLPASAEDSPVQFSWSTDAPEILDWEGRIGTGVGDEGAAVHLRCELYLGEAEDIWERTVFVCPEQVSEDERIRRQIQDTLDIQESTADSVTLPPSINGTPVTYSRKKENDSVYLALLGTILGLLLHPLWKAKQKEKAENRAVLLQCDYPDLVSRLLLFLQAGLTVRSSVEKIVRDYRTACKEGSMKPRPAYEELCAAYGELEGGMPEVRVYERFGNRCGIPEYKVLCVLLTQNLKKGSQGVLLLLEREAAAAMEERKRKAKIQGDQASTKLLAPMFIQLAIVLALLMVPAFLSFY